MNQVLFDIITADHGYIYIITFVVFVSGIIFRNILPVYVTIVLGIFLIFREEIREFVVFKNKKKHIRTSQVKTSKHINTSSLSERLLQGFKKYKKYNPRAYRVGKRYLYMFLNEVQGLSYKNHKVQLLDNAELYSQQSLKSFRSILFSIPETMYGSTPTTDIKNTLANLCETLENHMYKILYHKVQISNKDFKESPDIYKCEKIYDTDNVKQSNYYYENELS